MTEYSELIKILDDLLDPICIVDDKPIKSKKRGMFFGIPNEHGDMPFLRCPSFHGCRPMPEVLMKYIKRVNEISSCSINIVKVQIYEDGVIGIYPHTDKLIDLQVNSSIYIMRVNETDDVQRTIRFIDKHTGKETITFLQTGQIFETPYEYNKTHLHHVPAEAGNCISLVFRTAATFVTDDGFLYGQGAKYKTKNDIVNYRQVPNMDDVVALYNFENSIDVINSTLDHPLYQNVKNTAVSI